MISDKLTNAIRENCSLEDFNIAIFDDKWILKFLDWEKEVENE